VNQLRLFSLITLLMFAFPFSLLAEDEKSDEEGKEEAAVAAIHYYQLKPSLVANLLSGGRYIRCDIQLMTRDETLLEDLNVHDAALRHTLLLLLSDQDGAQIKSPDGKERLRKQALKQINQLLKEQTGKEAVESLFFTTFFVQ
jgi:flagellar FliL protein